MTLVLSRTDVLDLLSLPECIDAVERAFRLHAEGHTLGPGVLSVQSRDEITIFDSSGTALQDVAAAIAVYEKASASGRGTVVKLDA